MIRLIRIAVSLAVWLAGGVWLSRWVSSRPVEMPEFLDHAIRAGLAWIGRDDLANPDDMEVIAFLVVLAASLALCALVVAAANLALARAFTGRMRRL